MSFIRNVPWGKRDALIFWRVHESIGVKTIDRRVNDKFLRKSPAVRKVHGILHGER